MAEQLPAGVELVRIDQIRRDPSVRARSGPVDEAVVGAYARLLRLRRRPPPVVVFRDGDGVLWLADGWLRVAAAERLKRKTVEAEVHGGGREEAAVYAAGANATHGQPRSDDDKRKAIANLVGLPEFAQPCSVDAIRKAAKVSWAFAARVLAELGVERQEFVRAGGRRLPARLGPRRKKKAPSVG